MHEIAGDQLVSGPRERSWRLIKSRIADEASSSHVSVFVRANVNFMRNPTLPPELPIQVA